MRLLASYTAWTKILAKTKTGQTEITPVCPARSGRLDSNQRPLAPHANALPGCATSRDLSKLIFLRVKFSGLSSRGLNQVPFSALAGCKSKIKTHCPEMDSSVYLIFAQFLIDEASNQTGLHY